MTIEWCDDTLISEHEKKLCYFVQGRKLLDTLLFLGTGAADWSIKEKDKTDYFRRNSAALLNEDLMLDCGAHIFDFAESFGNPRLYANVTEILITHDHEDHLDRDSVLKLAASQKIRVACDGAARKLIGEHPNIEYARLTPYKRKKVGRYYVTPLLANHDVVITKNQRAFHYIIKTPEGKEIFYGLDGAWFLRPSWEEMKQHKYDLMVFDCTVGDRDDWRLFEHNTIPMLRKMIAGIRERQLLCSDGKLIATHMARTLHKSHEDTEQCLKEMGMITAYDGMKVQI